MNEIEYKANLTFTKAIEDRTVTGIFAVHGHIDDGGDRSHPGSFADVAVNGRNRVRFVWQHSMQDPPIAVVKQIRELDRNNLPPPVLAYAPDATGGVEVIREYLDTPRGNEVLAGIRAGAIEEMSYGYTVTRWDTEETEGGYVRNIYGVKLYDISDVLWGMQEATLASKRLPLADEHATVLATVQRYQDRLTNLAELRAKEGRVLSGDNRKRIESALEALQSAQDALKSLLAATEPAKVAALVDARALYGEYQRVLAQLNGVTIVCEP